MNNQQDSQQQKAMNATSTSIKKPKNQINDDESEDNKPKKNNDLKEIRTIKQLERVNLDFDSPRLKQAMNNLGISIDECINKERSDFEKKGVDKDVIDLRFKHYKNRLIETLNMVLNERKNIKYQ